MNGSTKVMQGKEDPTVLAGSVSQLFFNLSLRQEALLCIEFPFLICSHEVPFASRFLFFLLLPLLFLMLSSEENKIKQKRKIKKGAK